MPLSSMDRRPTTMAAVMMLATMTSSCQNTRTADAGPHDPGNAPVAVPDVRPSINPAPRLRYVLTLRFDGLPGEIADLDATADFEVENRECVPYHFSRAVGGVRNASSPNCARCSGVSARNASSSGTRSSPATKPISGCSTA